MENDEMHCQECGIPLSEERLMLRHSFCDVCATMELVLARSAYWTRLHAEWLRQQKRIGDNLAGVA